MEKVLPDVLLKKFLGRGAIDLGFCGSKFTWSNKRAGFANVKERLDRGVCNQEWQGLFPKAEIKPLIASSSDHNPILLDTHLEDNSRARPFRFEAMWTRDATSSQVVQLLQQAWQLQVERFDKQETS